MNTFFFKSKPRTPTELVRLTKDALTKLERDPERKKTMDDLAKLFQDIKRLIYGDGEVDPNPEQTALLAQEVYSQDLLLLIANSLGNLEFETRRDAIQVFNNLLRRQIGTRLPTVEYLISKEEVLSNLLAGYENPEIALSCGLILREAARHEPLAKIILQTTQFWSLFRWVDAPAFDIASDAWATFRELLTEHKGLTANFLAANYETFFASYSRLLMSSSYLTRLFSLRLLSEMLVNRANQEIMLRWVGDPENLKRIMIMMREKSRGVVKEALGVFKIFVSNPDKSPSVLDILKRNKDRLMAFIGGLTADRTEDEEQFADEKVYLLRQIEAL